MSKLFIKSLFLISAAASAQDLSSYQNFRLGTDLATVAKQTGQDPVQAKVIHRRPALMQDLDWNPQSEGSSRAAPTKDVTFSFYDGQLFRIAVHYDHYDTDGMTTEDMIEAISAKYGTPTKPPASSVSTLYGDQEKILAQWQDAQYRFELIRFSYGRDYKLVGTLKSLEAPFQAATVEAARLDLQDAPQLEAARVAKDDETERARLERVRLANKAKFKP
jgi:hypothetical protein